MTFRYEGVECPVCGAKLTEQDDVVVCPACGAPHHRDCWTTRGACYYEEQHGTEEAWQPPRDDHRTAQCPQCGAINAGSEERCNACGASMLGGTPLPDPPPQPDNSPPQPDNSPPYLPFSFSGNAALQTGGIPKTEPFEDTTAEEIETFVGPNAAYYMKKFWLINKLKRLGSVNFAALFFPGLWMLYRKMYRWGAVVTGVVYGLELLAIFISAQWSMPMLEGLYTRAGVEIGAYDMESMLRLGDAAMKMSAGEWLLAMLPMLLYLIVFGIGIYLCIAGNKLYYRHVIGKIRDIRTAQPDKISRTDTLSRQGGINFPVVISVAACYYIVSSLFEIYVASGL